MSLKSFKLTAKESNVMAASLARKLMPNAGAKLLGSMRESCIAIAVASRFRPRTNLTRARSAITMSYNQSEFTISLINISLRVRVKIWVSYYKHQSAFAETIIRWYASYFEFDFNFGKEQRIVT